jgi:hypothetical protein
MNIIFLNFQSLFFLADINKQIEMLNLRYLRNGNKLQKLVKLNTQSTLAIAELLVSQENWKVNTENEEKRLQLMEKENELKARQIQLIRLETDEKLAAQKRMSEEIFLMRRRELEEKREQDRLALQIEEQRRLMDYELQKKESQRRQSDYDFELERTRRKQLQTDEEDAERRLRNVQYDEEVKRRRMNVILPFAKYD